MDHDFLLQMVQAELLLFCAFFFLLGAIDDLAFDIVYVFMRARGKISRRRDIADFLASGPSLQGPVALFVPAWDEAAIIGGTLARMAACYAGHQVTIFVGCYPNDPETRLAIERQARVHAFIKPVLNDRPGPTTKGDCLNAIWRAMLDEENRQGWRFVAVALHDAEDMPHPDAMPVHRRCLDEFCLSQIPVVPIVPKVSPWLAGHYADEFAEAHGKELQVRQYTGAALPSAGTGCAFRRDFFDSRAALSPGGPFPGGSLVEDYELGLALCGHDAGQGRANAVIPMVRGRDGVLVAVRALFPMSLDAVVRQKSRWIAGIALAGWDRLGWHMSPAEIWMRLHDRRSIFAALVIALSYFVFFLSMGLLVAGRTAGQSLETPSGIWALLLGFCFLNLVYRMVVRAVFVTRMQGWRQGLVSIPRTFVANIIAIMASWRAVVIYARHCFGRPLKWDKTDHRTAVIVDE